jgi:UDP-N-acetylmuramoylalanine--D-glutamate ligase
MILKKKVSVLGLGVSGVAAANLAVSLGYEVFASDVGKRRKIAGLSKKVVTEFAKHSDKVLNADIVVKSPGLANDLPIIKKIKEQKIPLISELTFALSYCKPKKIIAVTGTNGKTTVTDLCGKIIASQFKNSVVAGNIGAPLSALVKKVKKNTVLTLELSSYQLEDTPHFKPDISVLLNITPDHLQHHKTLKNYALAKANIYKNQTARDYLICADALKLPVKPKCKVIYFRAGKIVLPDGKIINPKINIVGKHNLENIIAAANAAYLAGVSAKKIESAISKYKGVEHRIEFVKNAAGVAYYNDSKSTNVASTRVALEAFDKNIHLILGGLGKGAPYTPLRRLVKEKIKNVFLIGADTKKIIKDLSGSAPMINAKTLKNAVKKIKAVAACGDIVLFSPACASFDQFKNFEHRGSVFKKLVVGK